ncbi:recQ-mediated genome instability protein 1 [Leuresthes tenuis]|uniref:recQ-mediated genome instability protein 1 n=1 Tax=Leuresthes tenuis TaxID=355514 RepID=UPI003B509910
MAPDTQSVVRATQAWLLSTWHVQVPFAWLEACVEWLQGEAGGEGRLVQQQINQQVLDQWLLTDLRDLDYPVLPEGLAQAQKTELRGTFCVQVDSLLDISQPAYGQLQKWRGTDCTNDEVSAVTQATQRPWEAKSTRMLLLQVTDGVQSLEAMEYQSVPALSAAIRPGAKLQLQGRMVCRLGVLLLGPSNVKILGGEVEDLVDRNNQGRVLCRTLGLPEEQQQQQEEEAPQAPQQDNREIEDLEVDDAELLASLEGQGEADILHAGASQDSGYRTLQETVTMSSTSSSFRSHVSSRSETSSHSQRRGLTQSNRGGSVRAHHSEQQSYAIHQHTQQGNLADEDFPDEDFDDLPLDELDSVILLESENVSAHSHRSTPQNDNRAIRNPSSMDRATKPNTPQFEMRTISGFGSHFGPSNSRSTSQRRDHQGCTREASGSLTTASSNPFLSSTALEPSHELEFVTNDESNFMDEDMDCLFKEDDASKVQTERTGGKAQLHVKEGPNRDRESKTDATGSGCGLVSKLIKTETGTPQAKKFNPSTAELNRVISDRDAQSDRTVPDVTLTSPPFTYLCLLEELLSNPYPHTTEIHVKAFIVTLLGKLSSSNGVWSVCATISDGSGYLDVELSDEVLTSLLGFSVSEKGALKRDPSRRSELDAGMRRCQEELVDMCCIMKIVVEPEGRRAVVAKAEAVNERVLQELERRVRERRR